MVEFCKYEASGCLLLHSFPLFCIHCAVFYPPCFIFWHPSPKLITAKRRFLHWLFNPGTEGGRLFESRHPSPTPFSRPPKVLKPSFLQFELGEIVGAGKFFWPP